MKLYYQIYEDIKKQILKKEINHGDRLPSLKETAKKYQCSKGTVIKAYELLSQKHIIFSKPQSGYFVADNLLRNNNDKKHKYNLSTGNPLVESLSIYDIKHCLNIAAELYAKNSIDLDLRGTTSLNDYLPAYLARSGIYTKKENIHMIQGITPILAFLSVTPFPNNKKAILIEEPTFWNYSNFLKTSDLEVLTIPRDEDGIDLSLLEYYFKNKDIKFFYTIPRNHNPLGTTLSYHQRKRIMELALHYNVYIVEDDYFGDTFHIPKYVPIHYFSYQKNCIYLRSSSKEFPFIRIGIAVIPDSFQETFTILSKKAYYYSYHMPSLISQATYEAYLKSNLYEKQNNIINQEIKDKLQIIKKVSKEWDPSIMKVIGAQSGYYSTIQLHPSININYYISLLQKERVFVKTNKPSYFINENYNNSIRISVAIIQTENLNDALTQMYDLAKQLKKN